MAGNGQHLPKAGPMMPNNGQRAPVTPPKAAPTMPKQPPKVGSPMAPPPREEPPQWFCDLFLAQVSDKTQSRRRGPGQNALEMKKYWQVLNENKSLQGELAATRTQAGAGE